MPTEAIAAGVLDHSLQNESLPYLPEGSTDGLSHIALPDSPQKQAAELRYVARQPIMDLRSKVHGYELLFWNGRDPAFRAATDLASRTMLDNTVQFGVDKMACGLP